MKIKRSESCARYRERTLELAKALVSDFSQLLHPSEILLINPINACNDSNISICLNLLRAFLPIAAILEVYKHAIFYMQNTEL